MKAKSLTLALLFVVLAQPARALPRSLNTRASQPTARVADTAADQAGNQTGASQTVTLESMIPGEGLQFYFELRGPGLTDFVMPLSKLLTAGLLKVTTNDLTAFVMRNAGALSNAKLAMIGYGSGGAAAVIETTNAADAETLAAGIATLLGANRPSITAAKSDADVAVRGRMIIAGRRATVARLTQPNGAHVVADNQQLMKARARFSEDAFFAFVKLEAQNLGLPGASSGVMDVAQTAGMLGALSGMPYAIAIGGSLEGDSAAVRALLINGAKPGARAIPGLFSFVTSSPSSSQSIAANFAAPDADVFVDLMIDWDKLLDAIQSVIGTFAGAVAAGVSDPQSNGRLPAGGMQSTDLLAMAEASLGFSIKYDLLPTLGNEVAITLSGFSNVAGATDSQTGRGAAKRSSPRFILMVAVRDEAKFEKLLGKLINRPTGSTAQKVAQTLYRGATINSSKDFTYTITGGFLLAGGTAAEIRRAIDTRSLGNSLASTPEFRGVLGDSSQATLRAYVSSRLTKRLFKALLNEAVKAGGAPDELAQTAAQTVSPIGVSMMPDEDGLMIKARLPASLVAIVLASMLNAKPAPFGISPGVGVSDSSSRPTDGRATPKLTDDDIRIRRP